MRLKASKFFSTLNVLSTISSSIEIKKKAWPDWLKNIYSVHFFESVSNRILSHIGKADGFGKDHGLWTPNEAFFHWNPELLGLGRQVWQINSGAFWVFSAKLSAPILVQWVRCPCFPLFNHYFYKKQSLYIHIPNIYLGLGFEFGPQRIRDLFMCP